MMNQVILVGRITKDIELRHFENGNAVINFSLAVPRDYKNSQGEYETDFLDMQATNKIAELTAEYCKKGDLIGVRGRLEKKVRTDKEDKKHYDTYVRCDKVSFLSRKKDEIDKKENEYYNGIKTEENAVSEIEIETSDLPF